MADPLVWSKLPEHLIASIIDQSTDIKTLKNWCEATRAVFHLNRVALRLRWRTMTVSKKNLLKTCATEDLDYGFAKLGKDTECKNEVNQALCMTSEKPGYGIKPAVLMKRLVVNLQSGTGGPMSTDIDTHRNVFFTLKTLLPHASCLEEVEHFGFLQQELFDQIVGIPALTTLKLRQTHRYTEGPYEELLSYPDRNDHVQTVNLCSLSRATKLTCLDVSHLRTGEACRLAKAVRCMRLLQRLRIAEISDNVIYDGEKPSTPLAIFLSELYSKPTNPIDHASDTSRDLGDSDDPSYRETIQQKVVGLPAMLSSLELVDNTQWAEADGLMQDVWGFLHMRNPQSLTHLISMHLDIKHASVVVDILNIVTPVNLTHLTVSTFTPAILHAYLPSLNRLTLLYPWKNCNTPLLEHPFSRPNQLHLAAPPPKDRDGNKKDDYIQSIWEHNLSTRILGHSSKKPVRWGTELQHLRVDQVDLKKLRVDRIDKHEFQFTKLRVLVLRLPPSRAHGPWVWTLEAEPCPKEPPLPEPEQMMELPEAVIASQIAAQKLPELRLITVGKYRFWVQHPRRSKKHPPTRHKAKKERKTQIWFLKRALEDHKQEKRIQKEVTAGDWEFLRDRVDGLCEVGTGGSVVFLRDEGD